MVEHVKPPLWFWLLGGALLLRGLIGVAGFHVDIAMTASDLAKMDRYDQQLYAQRPGWLVACYGAAAWTGLIGTVLLLLRRRLAWSLYVVSLAGVLLLFGYMFVATDIIAHKGLFAAAGLPVLIAATCLLELWLTSHASKHGWLRYPIASDA